MSTGKKIIKYFIALFFITSLLCAESHKEIKKTFKVDSQKLIEIKSISGVDVIVKSWDKNEVYFNLNVSVSSSDKDNEDEYLKFFNIESWESSSGLVLEFTEGDMKSSGWSFWDLFKGKLFYKFSKSIRGEIFIPVSNSIKADFKYSEIKFSNIDGEINLPGKNNKLYLEDCKKISTIENDYGETFIRNSGGELILDTKSGEVDIQSFQGNAVIYADYSDIDITNVSGKLNVDTKSATVLVSDVGADLKMTADYSDVTINNIWGFSDLKNVSGTFSLSNTKGFYIDSPYSDIIVKGALDKEGKGIKIKNTSGKIDLYDITGNLVIDDGYSDIWLNTIKGDVNLSSKSSNIEAKKITGNWNSNTEYSEVSIKEISADEIIVSNKSAQVYINALKNPRRVQIDNEYGDVKVNIPRGFGGEILLDASYGGIETNLGVRVSSHGSSSSASGKVGNGNSSIIIETRSSNISLLESR